jgi:hypothetical protein
MNEAFDSKTEARLLFRSTCRSATGRSYPRQHTIDLSELRGIQRLGEPPLLKIARLMENLESHIRRVATGPSRMNINIYDAEDRELERKRHEEWRESLTKPKPD